jgi:hypothetical protein
MKPQNYFFLIFVLGFYHSVLFAQPQLTYIIPDLGTPNFATYVEFIAPSTAFKTFGQDGIYFGNSQVKIEPFNIADTSKIVIGPAIVSWDGRLISAHIFVKPHVTPNSSDWQALQPQYVIPLVVNVQGVQSAPQKFFIVQPTDLSNAMNEPDRLLGRGTLGKLSPRGSMLISNANFAASEYMPAGNYDWDPTTPGYQGFLLYVLLSTGKISGIGTTINVSGNRSISFSGGGGGGGFCAEGLFGGGCQGESGGSGFTGGGGGGRYDNNKHTFLNGGISSGLPNAIYEYGHTSINGVIGGATNSFESSGGGTGHPFGISGAGCNDSANGNVFGGFGGGSGNRPGEAGGSGGNARNGVGARNSGGKTHGNPQIVPLYGGSGGASGTPIRGTVSWTSSGSGGGGGGGISIHAHEIEGLNILANGGNGGTGTQGCGGGGGSGGNVIIGARIANIELGVSIVGGDGENVGAPGRFRLDAPIGANVISPIISSISAGIFTDTTKILPSRDFTLRGYASGIVDIFVSTPSQPQFIQYASVTAAGFWQLPMILPGNDSINYISACVRISNPSSDTLTAIPVAMLSQSSWNIIRIVPSAYINSELNKNIIFALPCDTIAKYDTLYIQNIGDGTLEISSIFFEKSNRFTVVSPSSATVLSGDSLMIIVRITQPNQAFDPILDSDSLRIVSNDGNYLGTSYAVHYEVHLESILVSNNGVQDFGNVYISQQSSKNIAITNNGISPIIIRNASHIFTEFSVTPQLPFTGFPIVLNPGATANFTVEFTPSAIESEYSDTVRFEIENSFCSIESNIPLHGFGINPLLVSLRLPVFQDADPSLKNYKVPIFLSVLNPSKITSITDSLYCKVRFDGTMFFPKGISNGTVLSIQRNGNMRTIEFLITNVTIKDQQNLIVTEVIGDLLLGLNEVSPITFDSVQLKSIVIDTVINGRLDLLICEDGGDRLLLGGTNFFVLLQPNPASTSVSVEIQPREIGTHSLSIFDVSGKNVLAPITFEPLLQPNGIPSFQKTIDVSVFPNGVYNLVIQTPTNVFTYPMQIVR